VHSLLNDLLNLVNLANSDGVQLYGSAQVLVSVFESIHVRSLQIYAYFMVAIRSTIFIMILHVLNHKMIFFTVLDV